jgi:fatty-acyl-CoA synthase
MQSWPMTLDKIITHAANTNPHAKVVTRGSDMKIRRGSYKDIESESRRVSRALAAHGLGAGNTIATLAWNNDHHLALWYGLPAVGAIVHPLNPRFSPEQLVWIIRHASDAALFFDSSFLPLVEAIRPSIPHVGLFVLLVDEGQMPANSIGAISIEAFLATGDTVPDPVWGDFPEDSASGLFYTSGTTGNPKGVLYSHRSTMLHTLLGQIGYMITPADVVMPAVPMFHANCWGMAHIPPMVGASLALPGPGLNGAAMHELIETEGVTAAVGVPSMWTLLYTHLKETGSSVPTLKRLFSGGSAVPRSMIKKFKDDFDVDVVSAWGMTEMSPSGAMNDFLPEPIEDEEVWLAAKARAGRFVFGVEAVIKSDDGAVQPHDGQSAGRLMVRGPGVIASYFRSDASALDADGYFDTGDIAVIHPDEVMQITDRAKDLIKSGGEWISSIDMEDAATLHPAIEMCAVIGIPHPKWEERPLLVVKSKPEMTLSAGEIRAFLVDKVPQWWIPEEVVLVDNLPIGATGKIDKKVLRTLFAERYGLVGG